VQRPAALLRARKGLLARNSNCKGCRMGDVGQGWGFFPASGIRILKLSGRF
jgi:hypothetical protein